MPGFLSASVSGQVRIVFPRLWESLLHTSRLLGLRGRGWPQRPRKSWLLQVDANATSPTWERACEMWMEGPGRQAGAPESGRASPPGTGVGSPPEAAAAGLPTRAYLLIRGHGLVRAVGSTGKVARHFGVCGFALGGLVVTGRLSGKVALFPRGCGVGGQQGQQGAAGGS